MGIFITAVVIEITFAAYSIITKSNQQSVRNFIRIIAFIGFVLLSTLSVIHWSFRYYTLASLLLILAIFGVIGLLKRKQDERVYQTGRIIKRTIGLIALFFIATLPSIIFPQYDAIKPTGKYLVETQTYTYTDTKRIETYMNLRENRKLNVGLWYPKNTKETYPLIVFSHGALGIKTSNETLYNELASHGYIIASIDHTFQSLYTTDENGFTRFVDKSYMKELTNEDAKSNKQQSYELYQKWMKIRTDDINFVIDYLLEQANNNASEQVYNLVDTSRIGVMGHSLGGSAALGIGRIRKDVSAVIALESPFMLDIEGVMKNEFVFTRDKYPVPVLNVYSDSSWDHLGDWPQYAKNYALLTNNDPTAFNVHIRGVGHLTLTDLALTSPFFTRILNGHKSPTDTEYSLKVINKVSLEFFDCYLKGEEQFISDGSY